MFKNSLSPLYLLNGWIVTTHAEIDYLDMEKNWSDLSDFDLIFNVAGGQKVLKNALYALYLLNGSMDFNKTYIDTSLGDETELISFW